MSTVHLFINFVIIITYNNLSVDIYIVNHYTFEQLSLTDDITTNDENIHTKNSLICSYLLAGPQYNWLNVIKFLVS